jgi:hypothetical protein
LGSAGDGIVTLHEASKGWRSTRQSLACLLVAVLTALYMLPIVPLGLNIYDEGIRFYGAQRVLAGDVPYHDFFAYYGPGQFYWPAVLFKLFGTRILVARLGALFFLCLAAAASFALCRKAGLSVSLSSLPAVALVLPIQSGDEIGLCDPALSLTLASGAALTGAWGPRPNYFVAGLLLGIAVAFRHDFGAYATVACIVSALWMERQPNRQSPRWALAWKEVATAVWRLRTLIGGIALVAIPVYGLLALRGGYSLFEALVVLPPQMMPYRTLPYGYDTLPALSGMYRGAFSGYTPLSDAMLETARATVFMTPPLALILGFCLVVRGVRQEVSQPRERLATLLLVLVCAGGVAVYALARSNWRHVYPLHVLGVCAICLIAGALRSPGRSRLPGRGLCVAVVVSFALGSVFVARMSHFATGTTLSLSGADRVVVNPDLEWVRDAVHDIWTYGDPGALFVASQQHDRVYINALILYVLAKRPAGTYFHDFIPGVTTTREVQERIVTDLNMNHVRTVFVWRNGFREEPNRSRLSSRVFVLDDYLRTEFVRVRETKDYEIFTRRN